MDEEYFHRFNDATNAAIIRLIYTALCIVALLQLLLLYKEYSSSGGVWQKQYTAPEWLQCGL
jgi:hypothetical protein